MPRYVLLIIGSLLAMNQAVLGLGDEMLVAVFGDAVNAVKLAMVAIGAPLSFLASQSSPNT